VELIHGAMVANVGPWGSVKRWDTWREDYNHREHGADIVNMGLFEISSRIKELQTTLRMCGNQWLSGPVNQYC